VEKYVRPGQATDDNMGHAYLRIKTHFQNMHNIVFSIATMVTRTRLNITLHVHCLLIINYTAERIKTASRADNLVTRNKAQDSER